eukprot:CAMPEP_0113560250 /NCGR_PEP_ID=MMETSP0015_2-20120614/19329_1 /TAXON_ID=2838 /ORGANISM="Odontella" /LENGTH=546 /DNA_ID=CAMNT_0000461939 /DNA_START=158 /DNA_END=1800 /DNA_ORIENTATION=+ /assembly_acc=CAM_ASM_000160
MSEKSPVVVQGTAVASPYDHASGVQPAELQDSSGEFTRGEKQEVRCRDPIFAILLYANVGAIAAVVGAYGTKEFEDAVSGASDLSGYLYAAHGFFLIVFSALGLSVMMACPETLIKTSLIFVVIMSGVWAALAFWAGNIIAGVIGIVFFLLMCCYARAVWSRIPFATVNLVTAITAVKKNCGIIPNAYFMVAVAFGWSLLWTVAFLEIWERTSTCTTNSDGKDVCSPNYGYLFLLFVSYFFTHQVIQNTIHTTTAGVVGTWWFAPEEAGSCCSPAVKDSMCRSLTTSFGSICFGSLVVAIIQALRQLANTARANDDGNAILLCIAECLLDCLASIVEYFNKWAYIYVGLYGYSYMEAGKNVFTLFKNRGWEAIIADDLVSNTLFFVSVCVGLLSGAVGVGLAVSTDWFNPADDVDGKVACFVLGLIIGLVLTSIMMSVVGSGVNAVLVCFAEAPAEFQQNHPELSERMRETWLAAFPDCIDPTKFAACFLSSLCNMAVFSSACHWEKKCARSSPLISEAYNYDTSGGASPPSDLGPWRCWPNHGNN